MNNLNKCQSQIVEQKLVSSEVQPDSDTTPISSLIKDIIHRWYIILSVFLVMCSIGIPAIWFLKKPVYEVTCAIRVAPILTDIISGKADKGEISNYQSFMNTQATMITSSQVIQRVADDLVDKNLKFFKDAATDPIKKLKQTLKGTTTAPEPAATLKQAISKGIIKAAADRRSELIKITMGSKNPEEAKQIVDAFSRAYMAVEVSSFAEVENQKLRVLEDEHKVYFQKMQEQRKIISQLAQEYGAKDLAGRRDMKLERVASLLAQVTEHEARRIYLEATVELLEKTKEEQTIGPEELLQMRNEYVNADPVIAAFATNITQLEQELIVAHQRLTDANPELKDKVQLVESLKARIVQLKEEAGETFDKLVAEKTAKINKEKLNKTLAELGQVRAYEQRFRELLAKEDTETIGVGRTQVAILDLEDELALTKETYNNINRRIKELEMELKRPARISIAYNADVAFINDKRIKLTLALIFGAMTCGVLLSFLMARADQRLQTPDDVTKSIGVRILGTTTSLRHVKKALLSEQLAKDYQIICENLELLSGNGEEIPKKLIVTSPGPREGKTTFAINLATSISRSGKKVLLIDGDLRKPDIAYMLNLPEGSKGLQDVLFGGEFDKYVYHMPSIRLDVLATDSNNASRAYELLVIFHKARYIDKISPKYDHIIIDTPPALVFPDALVWARIAGTVILTSFAGQTTAPALKELKERLSQTSITVLGTVLSNVHVGHSYYRHARNYYERNHRDRTQAETKGADIKRFLLPLQESKQEQ